MDIIPRRNIVYRIMDTYLRTITWPSTPYANPISSSLQRVLTCRLVDWWYCRYLSQED